jgi:hypothetical protein
MDIALTLSGLSEIESLWRRAPEIAERHLRKAMEESLLLLQREVVDATPTGAHQLLRKSIVAEPVETLAEGLLGAVDVADRTGKYGSVLNYAVSVELGTKPHMPPVQPLIDWVKAKLGQKGSEAKGTAEAIRWKIYHRGTEGAHMFGKTMEQQRAYVQGLFDRAVAGIVRELGV